MKYLQIVELLYSRQTQQMITIEKEVGYEMSAQRKIVNDFDALERSIELAELKKILVVTLQML